jgi:glycosyltransferase involved in cell wall biosynthesis
LPYPGPIFVYVGRVAVEKNLEAFLDLDLPGTKLIVGGGPALETLEGALHRCCVRRAQGGRGAGAVLCRQRCVRVSQPHRHVRHRFLEALASGLPVAAFPITGPIDVITDPKVGVLSTDLREAALAALTLKREDCVAFAQNYSWHASATSFFQHLHPSQGRLERSRL